MKVRLGGRRFWIISVGALLILTILFYGLAPQVIQMGLERWLDSRSQISAKIQDVDFNIFSGRVTIYALLARREGTEGRLVWERASSRSGWCSVLPKWMTIPRAVPAWKLAYDFVSPP